MQFTSFATFFTLAIIGVSAAPNGGYGPGNAPPPPPPPSHPKPSPPPSPPVAVSLQNTCSSGAPYCCSPTITDGETGTTCALNQGPTAVQCDTITICCNNNAINGVATQNCGGMNSLAQPVKFQPEL